MTVQLLEPGWSMVCLDSGTKQVIIETDDRLDLPPYVGSIGLNYARSGSH